MSATLLTASQTVGPFFAPALLREGALRNVLTGPDMAGERIRIEGRVLDGDGLPVPDAMVEIWQANSRGHYNHPVDPQPGTDFIGYGRSGTDEDGTYWFETIKPGPVPFDARHMQAPHIVVTVFSRGLLNHAVTRLYFADDPANASDPILRYVPEERRATLLAQPTVGTRFIASTNSSSAVSPSASASSTNSASGVSSSDASALYRFDIIMQGAGETVFFNV